MLFSKLFTLRVKDIKDINYPQIKIWIYRGHKNKFGEKMWGKYDCRYVS